MFRVVKFLLLLGAVNFISCETDGIENEELSEDLNAEIEQYFTAEINGEEEVKVTDTEFLDGEIFTNPETGVVSLTVYGGIGKSPSSYEDILITVCFYKGVGDYTTGNNRDNSYAYYWTTEATWYSDPGMGDPGRVKIIKASDSNVEGEYKINAYDYDEIYSPVAMEGNFKVAVTHRNTWQ